MKHLIFTLLIALVSTAAAAACDTSRFTVTHNSARVDDYGDTRLTVSVRNDNDVACSAKVQVHVMDKQGNLIGTQDAWIVTENYAPGTTRTTSFRLKKDLAKGGAKWNVAPSESRVWEPKK